ncbi:12783_t:CDS:2, partial [Acaulospora colombiana]
LYIGNQKTGSRKLSLSKEILRYYRPAGWRVYGTTRQSCWLQNVPNMLRRGEENIPSKRRIAGTEFHQSMYKKKENDSIGSSRDKSYWFTDGQPYANVGFRIDKFRYDINGTVVVDDDDDGEFTSVINVVKQRWGMLCMRDDVGVIFDWEKGRTLEDDGL